MARAFTLDGTYIHLKPDDSARILEGGERFWAGVEERRDLDHGRLMGASDQAADWDHWERHPAGEEILTLLSGEMELSSTCPEASSGPSSRRAKPSSCRAASGIARSCRSPAG